MTDTDKNFLSLTLLEGVGAVTINRLISHFKTVSNIYKASRSELMMVEKIGEKTADSIIKSRTKINVQYECDKIKNFGANFISRENTKYPKLLKEIFDTPIGLYYKGDVDFNSSCISIVGCRHCSVYGQTIARKFAYGLAKLGFVIVSGLARGIDSAAHIGAIEANGKTIAVLGCGLDIIYPPENVDLYKKISQNGAIVSEFKLGTRADKQTFPIRNRIIAALSRATLVVESDLRGGSMITARLAVDYGRDVFAIPGRIDSESSRGCHALIRDGAILVSSIEDIASELGCKTQVELEINPPKPIMDNDEMVIYEILSNNEPHSIDEIVDETLFPISKVLGVTMKMELKKLIHKMPDGRMQKKFNLKI